eukprot:1145391-Pelagomonas_calceolata.AAC.1
MVVNTTQHLASGTAVARPRSQAGSHGLARCAEKEQRLVTCKSSQERSSSGAWLPGARNVPEHECFNPLTAPILSDSWGAWGKVGLRASYEHVQQASRSGQHNGLSLVSRPSLKADMGHYRPSRDDWQEINLLACSSS